MTWCMLHTGLRSGLGSKTTPTKAIKNDLCHLTMFFLMYEIIRDKRPGILPD